MAKYVIQGGQKLSGRVRISGAKNSALKLLAASLMGNDLSIIRGVPRIKDIFTMAQVLEVLGAQVEFTGHNDLLVNPTFLNNYVAPYELVSRMRASILVMGPLLARLGIARVAMPGGCNIGSRQIDLHLKGLSMMGASIEQGHGYIEARAKGRLKGTVIPLDFPSVGATENLLMAACLAEGETVIENAAREPEVGDLAHFLGKMGAQIEGIGTSTLLIQGVENLHGAEHRVIPDRIEAGTFMIAAATTGGNITLENVVPRFSELVIGKLRDMGVDVLEDGSRLHVSRNEPLEAVDISTLPYPGFPTDLQALMMVLLSLAEGVSIVTENVFDNRFIFVNELNRMGARIRVEGHHAMVYGGATLSGAPVKATDLRAGAALVVAGLVAEGETEVHDIEHIERGYENLDQKLRDLGADIEKVSGESQF
ncbi:MAG: UDP-N-acetylglucosamine 1-carboxyvinyltransferase 1 [Actinobacteria bacterium]|nr:UDP-N-acetylglucosamine 1-carboxyvinyltransferase 1 [Actinomycetota bacterium]